MAIQSPDYHAKMVVQFTSGKKTKQAIAKMNNAFFRLLQSGDVVVTPMYSSTRNKRDCVVPTEYLNDAANDE
jgi:hypothetical protein